MALTAGPQSGSIIPRSDIQGSANIKQIYHRLGTSAATISFIEGRRCRFCNTELVYRGHGPRRYYCGDCYRTHASGIYKRRYRESHSTILLEKGRLYREKNRERIRVRSREWARRKALLLKKDTQ